MTTTIKDTDANKWQMFVTLVPGTNWRTVHIMRGGISYARPWHENYGYDPSIGWHLERGEPTDSSRDWAPELSELDDPSSFTYTVSEAMLEKWYNFIERLEAENKKLRKELVFKDFCILATFVVFLLIPLLCSIF